MKISFNSLRDQAIDLVKEKGEDYRGYPGAYFRPDGAPGCLLGELIANKGATATDLKFYGVNKGGVGDLNSIGWLIPEDSATKMALIRLQNLNDHGVTWFDAVCTTFGYTPTELREEIANRTKPAVSFDVTGYVDWVASYEEKPVVEFKPLPVHAPVVSHVLAA